MLKGRFILFFLVAGLQLLGQQVEHTLEQLTTEEGVAKGTVSPAAIHEDRRGFMWIGSEFGLHRYDGRVFKQYTQKTHGIQQEQVQQIVTAPDQKNLWLIYKNATKHLQIDHLNISKEEITPLESIQPEINAFLKTPISNSQTSFANENTDGSLWLFGEQELYEAGVDDKIEAYFSIPDSLRFEKAVKLTAKIGWAIVKSKEGNLYAICIKKGNEVLQQTLIGNYLNKEYTIDLQTLNKQNQILIKVADVSKTQDLHQFFKLSFGQKLEPIAFSTQLNYEEQVYLPTKKEIWCRLPNATTIDHFDLNGNFLYQAKVKGDHIASLELFSPLGNYCDRNGSLWHKSSLGFIILHSTEQLFDIHINYNNPDKNADLLITNSSQIIEDKNGILYINSPMGTFYLDQQSKQFKTLPSIEGQGAVSSDRAGLWVDGNQSLWIATKQQELLEFDLATKSYKTYLYNTSKYSPDELPEGQWSIFRSKRGRLWVGHNQGLSFLNEETGFLEHWKAHQPLLNAKVYDIYENKEGLWIISSNGLYLMDANKEQIISSWSNDKNATHLLPYQYFTHIHEDQDQTLWLTTRGGGLIQLLADRTNYKQYLMDAGLSSNTLYAIYEDQNNRLWISSENGINVFDKKTQQISYYTKLHGFLHNTFNIGSHCQTKDGRIFFGSRVGLVEFNPNNIKTSSVQQAPLHLAQISIFDTETNKYINYVASEQDTILDVYYTDRDMILTFALLDYRTPDKHSYRYKIVGINEEWRQTYNPEIQVGGLDNGNYKLLIQACGASGVWSDSISISLVAHKPYYLELWFIVLALVIITILLFSVFRFRLYEFLKIEKRLRKELDESTKQIVQDKKMIETQAENLKALDKLKSRFFANISHELRTPLTLILGHTDQLIQEKTGTELKALQTVQRNAQQLFSLIEEILDLSKLDAHKLDLKEKAVHVKTLFKQIYSMYESQALVQKIKIDLDLAISDNLLVYLDSNKVSKIINNLISNALKFTPKGGKIIIQVKEEEKRLLFSVQDSGKGIHPDDLPHLFDRFYQSKQPDAPAQGGTGIGLAFALELAKLMNGELHVTSKLNKGSLFQLDLPKKIAQEAELVLSKESLSQTTLLVEEKMTREQEESLKQFEERIVVESTGESILLVEDNPDMREYVHGLLSPKYKVTLAENGLEALRLLEKDDFKPHLIVSDVMMPEMDGFELVKRVKASDHWRGIPIILLTARAAEKDKLNALTMGVDDYLTKPFAQEELMARVRNLLTNMRMRALLPIESAVDVAVSSTEESKEPIEEKIVISARDQEWIKQMEVIVSENVDNEEFNAQSLIKAMLTSKSTLQRRLKKITGMTPLEYIREVRLQTAKTYWERGDYDTIVELSYAVGFSAPYYFGKLYEKRFGKKIRNV